MSDPRVLRIRKHLPSFTLALSTLPEESTIEDFSCSPTSPRDSYINRQPSDSSDLMMTADQRSSKRSAYSIFFSSNNSEHDSDDGSDIETDCGWDYDNDVVSTYSKDSATIVNPPLARLMFIRSLVWRLLRRCPECGEKIKKTLDSKPTHTTKTFTLKQHLTFLGVQRSSQWKQWP
ncbi:hypothetical protein FA15DRAFT_675751 [Coprinopsis marcescibilis]|uniref:Uncharacterized protein n=1 Tax=Coprinopsis marcescibilis TaxID=230819 RepID=A0A5C3KD20_COPMA|nr:hypothetical protein FA15DRAFT_675751 [Coprinopsis marcescibilis]